MTPKSLVALLALFGSARTNIYEGYTDFSETVFVFEMVRHGARADNGIVPTSTPPDFYGKGVGKGMLTDEGRSQHLRNGLQRRREYIKGKKFLSEKFDPEEILSFSTFKERCAVSGQFFLHGMYPLQDLKFQSHKEPHTDPNSPLSGTTYEETLQLISKAQKQPVCESGPVFQVPPKSDIMMHTMNCKRVHDYLNKDKFDMQRLEREMTEYFGAALVEQTKLELKAHFGLPADNIRSFFEMLDARVAEIKHSMKESEKLADYQRQECFILANNFIGDDTKPSDVYLSRMIVPFTRVMRNKIKQD